MGDPYFRGHTWQWDRRTRVAEHRPWLRAGCYCWYPLAALLEHPPGHDQTPASMQVTDFIFSVGSEIQSHTNNCVCFPHRFQSGINSYRKSQMLIKFASPLISNAVACKFFSWMGAANLNTWCVPVLSESDPNWGEQVSLNTGTVIFKQHFCFHDRQEKPSSSKAEFGIQLKLLLNPQGIPSCLKGCWSVYF